MNAGVARGTTKNPVTINPLDPPTSSLIPDSAPTQLVEIQQPPRSPEQIQPINIYLATYNITKI
jgi:hypothetical protein